MLLKGKDMSTKILNPSQAEAVYSAMCHLNNVSGKIKVTLPRPGWFFISDGSFIKVFEDDEGFVKIRSTLNHSLVADEFYDNQSAFATAYNLQQG